MPKQTYSAAQIFDFAVTDALDDIANGYTADPLVALLVLAGYIALFPADCDPLAFDCIGCGDPHDLAHSVRYITETILTRRTILDEMAACHGDLNMRSVVVAVWNRLDWYLVGSADFLLSSYRACVRIILDSHTDDDPIDDTVLCDIMAERVLCLVDTQTDLTARSRINAAFTQPIDHYCPLCFNPIITVLGSVHTCVARSY